MNERLLYGIVTLLTFVALLGGIFIVGDLSRKQNFSTQQAALLAQSTAAAPSTCIDRGEETFPCYETYYTHLVKTFGTRAAFDDLKARYAGSTFIKGECHQLTHVIGHEGAELYPTPAEAFTHGDSFCWSGYYHGVMEKLVGESTEETLPQAIANICADIPNKESYTFDYYNCVHGLGHGIMAVLSDELFDSLTVCDTLLGEWEKSSCAGGVFMENVMAETRAGGSKYLKEDGVLYPCTAVDEQHKQQCYLMQTSHILAVKDYDFSAVFKVCAGAEPAYRATCYQSLGRDASGSTSSNIEKTKAICALGETAAEQRECAVGAAKDFVSYFHSDTQAYKLCDAFASPATRTTCRDTVKTYYLSF